MMMQARAQHPSSHRAWSTLSTRIVRLRKSEYLTSEKAWLFSIMLFVEFLEFLAWWHDTGGTGL